MNMQTATLALGCFWGPDARFGAHPAVIRTRVGYAGGTTPDPSYQHISDYIEAIELDYDADLLSYSQLLDLFWQFHNPSSAPYKRQYISAIFPHNPQQAEIAQQSLQAHACALTEIIPLDKFYLAENYHQKYHLQQYPQFMDEFQVLFPSFNDFIDSTLATRANGLLAGYADLSVLTQAVSESTLSANIKQQLLALYRK